MSLHLEDVHLEWLQIMAMVTNAAINTDVQVPPWYVGNIPKRYRAGSWVSSYFRFCVNVFIFKTLIKSKTHQELNLALGYQLACSSPGHIRLHLFWGQQNQKGKTKETEQGKHAKRSQNKKQEQTSQDPANPKSRVEKTSELEQLYLSWSPGSDACYLSEL